MRKKEDPDFSVEINLSSPVDYTDPTRFPLDSMEQLAEI